MHSVYVSKYGKKRQWLSMEKMSRWRTYWKHPKPSKLIDSLENAWQRDVVKYWGQKTENLFTLKTHLYRWLMSWVSTQLLCWTQVIITLQEKSKNSVPFNSKINTYIEEMLINWGSIKSELHKMKISWTSYHSETLKMKPKHSIGKGRALSLLTVFQKTSMCSNNSNKNMRSFTGMNLNIKSRGLLYLTHYHCSNRKKSSKMFTKKSTHQRKIISTTQHSGKLVNYIWIHWVVKLFNVISIIWHKLWETKQKFKISSWTQNKDVPLSTLPTHSSQS